MTGTLLLAVGFLVTFEPRQTILFSGQITRRQRRPGKLDVFLETLESLAELLLILPNLTSPAGSGKSLHSGDKVVHTTIG